MEGYSNFLWVLIGAISIWLGLDAEVVFKVLGAAGLFGTGLLVHRLARYWLGPGLSLVPMVVTLSYTGTYFWGLSGLETSFYMFWCLLTLNFAFDGIGAEEPKAKARPALLAAAGVAASLASLTRFEGPLLVVAVVAGLMLGAWGDEPEAEGFLRDRLPPALRKVAWFAGPFLAIYLPYFVFRWLHFGEVVPNSVACKSVLTFVDRNLVIDWLVFLPLAVPAVVAVWRRQDTRTLTLGAFCLLYLLLVSRADAILGFHNRYFLPALGPIAVLAGIPLLSRWRWRPVYFVATVILVAGALVLFELREVAAFAKRYVARQERRAEMARWSEARVPEDGLVAAGDVGRFGWEYPGRIWDLKCLNAPEYTQPPLNGDLDRIADHVMELRPDVLLMSGKPEDGPSDGHSVYSHVAAHPQFDDRYEVARIFSIPLEDYQYWAFVPKTVPASANPETASSRGDERP